MKFKSHPYQGQIIEWELAQPRNAVYAGMGMGKTVATLTALAALDLTEPGPALVLAPLRVAASTWPDEAAKWDHLAGFDVVPVVGTAEQRRAALRRPAPVYATNYEQLPWLAEHYGEKWPFRTIVADESTRLKSFRMRQGGKRAMALAGVAHTKVDRFIQLTGTPTPNGLMDLWGQLWFLDAGARLGRSFRAFTDRYFSKTVMPQGFTKYDPIPGAQDRIQDRLTDICLTVDPADHFDLSAPLVNVITVDLPKRARQLYQDMERDMFMQIETDGIEAANAAARTIKCLQLANGAVYTDDKGAWAEVHDEKLKALDSIVTEAAGAPVLVAYHFKSDLARLLRTFKQGRHLDKDPQTIRDWNAGKIPLLFAHPASAGHGLNLADGGNILVFFAHWWDLEQYQQIIERVGPTRQAQAGHNRPTFIHHIIARDTVDNLVMARREGKKQVQELLLEAMKR